MRVFLQYVVLYCLIKKKGIPFNFLCYDALSFKQTKQKNNNKKGGGGGEKLAGKSIR